MECLSCPPQTEFHPAPFLCYFINGDISMKPLALSYRLHCAAKDKQFNNKKLGKV